MWQLLHDELRRQVRVSVGKGSNASAGRSDSQSVKPTKKRGRSIVKGGGKIIKRRKRFILVDTLGLLICVVVMNGNCSEQRGGMIVVDKTDQAQAKALQLIWIDQGYQGENFARVIEQCSGAKIEVVKRSEAGFVV